MASLIGVHLHLEDLAGTGYQSDLVQRVISRVTDALEVELGEAWASGHCQLSVGKYMISSSSGYAPEKHGHETTVTDQCPSAQHLGLNLEPVGVSMS